jgi:HEAT repeat protein
MEISLPTPEGAVPAALRRAVAKYRRDVHQLAVPAHDDALASLEGHLGMRLPPGLRRFLQEHNGASLFRGALRLRSTSEMAPASSEASGVVLFADGNDGERWAWARDASGPVFGRWVEGALEPLHRGFDGWMSGCIAVLETRVANAADVAELRFEADPHDAYQQIAAGARALAQGDPERAERFLGAATQALPDHPVAWQYLGDALAVRDRSAARQAWLEAFRRTRLPRAYPGAPIVAPEVLSSLSRTLHDAEDWERELRRFLDERVHDITDGEGAAVVEAVTVQLARSLVERGHRTEARDVLQDLLSTCRAASRRSVPWPAVMELVRLEMGLGHHDEAEALIRRVRREGPSTMAGAAAVCLAEIAVTRQEPWAEDIFQEARQHELAPEDELRLRLSMVERSVRGQRAEEAGKHLEGLTRLARRVGKPGLEALVCLAQGDVKRLSGRLELAMAAYDEGLKRCGNRDPEVRDRLHLRRADLLLIQGDRDGALHACTLAVQGFAASELPVREAWGLLRLARLRAGRDGIEAPLVQAARERFVAADLAAGVAALDSMVGDPGLSLAWHLERSTAQARARYDAQRARPPYDRSDADRPERRLGSHRLAIAACDVGVVRALADQMDRSARAVLGRGRPTDPPVLQYVASVDLLSGHRSYDASAVLLEHLLQQKVDGVALRALQGAIARSPNAALVDGLLRCVESPGSVPSQAVAAAAELLGLRRERSAVPALLKLAQKGSSVRRKAAVTALGRIGDRRAVDGIAAVLDDPALAEVAALALLMLGDRRGVDFHGRALMEQRTDLSGHPGEIVGRYGGPDHLLLLVRAAKGESERALGALQGLGLLGDPRGVPALLEALHARSRQVVEVASGALQILTGHEEDADDPGVRSRWHQWWEENAAAFPEGVRHRDGKVFDAGLLIDKMSHPDPWTRRTAYDELVITVGHDLPFDADGPWRVQQNHIRAWRAWWGGYRHKMLPGRWYLDGVRVH